MAILVLPIHFWFLTAFPRAGFLKVGPDKIYAYGFRSYTAVLVGPLDSWYRTARVPGTGSKVPICMVTFAWESPK
jgi:hypothetical protein